MDEEALEPGRPISVYWLALALFIVVALGGWLYTHHGGLSAQDKRMLKAARRLDLGLSRYYTDHTEFAEKLEQAADYLPSWPVEPYTGQPIAESGSAVFDPATSVGTVHLEPILRDEVQVGWNLYVFGAHGELDKLSNILVMDTG